MANRLHVLPACIVILLVGLGPAQATGKSYCERLDEMREVPLKSDMTTEDEVYNGLIREGKKNLACLLGKVTDTRLMPDPRMAPPDGGFAVGDAAIVMLERICNTSIEDALPAEIRAQWYQRGVYAYFEYVYAGVENRRQIADALERQGCD